MNECINREVSPLGKLVADFLKAKHCGCEKAIKAEDIKRYFTLTPRQIRLLVNELRMAGFPICSGGEGYYYAANAAEVEKTQKVMRSQAMSMLAAADGMSTNIA